MFTKKTNIIFVYFIAILVVFIWGTTFISSKILLQQLTPAEILIVRFTIAYLLFVIVDPKFKKPRNLHDELIFALAGFLGITVYFICENSALLYGTASNVSLLVATSPLLTGLISHLTNTGERITKKFMLGGILCLAGVGLIVFNGSFILKLNPVSDLLAICAAIAFALYSVVIKSIDENVYSASVVTRKTFFYALLSLLPFIFTKQFNWDLGSVLTQKKIFGNIIFLGVVASSIRYLLWNKVIWHMGAVKANNLIYLAPPISLVVASIILKEQITVYAILGGISILIGVYISQKK